MIGPTRVTLYVQIITVDRAAVQRSTVLVNSTDQHDQYHPMHSQLIFGPNAILGTSIIYSALRNVDFVSCDITVVSSLKGFRFLLPFVYLKEF